MSTKNKISQKERVSPSFLEGTFLERGPHTPCTSCYCKNCCYHCHRCFLQKGLGITYARRQRRHRRRTPQISEDSTATARNLPTPRRTQENSKQEKTTVETEEGSASPASAENF
uniref:Protein Tat n=1 Tax=Simian immunodeficiency virus TaxID=11723 RepID=A0A1P8NRS4_SIV|nr:tat protein [Simian immunodeficiency virus]